MNIIDKKFNILVKKLEEKTLEEVFTEIKSNFLNIPIQTQKSIEDYFLKFPYWGKLNRSTEEYEELYNRAKSLKEHLNDYIWLYNKLEDYRSKKLLYAIINNWYKSDFITLSSSLEKNYSHYFDLDLIPKCNNEVFVDLGSYTGDTVEDYINTYGKNSYKKIYCYEITKEVCEVLKNNTSKYDNITIVNKAASNENKILYINKSTVDNSANSVTSTGTDSIESIKIDDDIEEEITMIKMDIEGSEEKAIIGCEKHIKKDKPLLLISVYHNHEDLYKLPRLINSYNSEYKFYLRCYGSNIFPTEIVLIAK